MGGKHQLLLLCTLMGLARSQSSTTPVPVTPSDGCWYDSLCAYSDDNDTSVVIPSQNADLESRMAWCYNQCINEPTCTDFTDFGSRGGHTCYLLTNCDDKSQDDDCLGTPVGSGSCNSGPKDCANNNNCDILPSPPPADTIPWECDHDVNPYDQQAPEGTECFISCNAWLDSNEDQASIVSKCVGGTWLPSEVIPSRIDPSDILALPNPLPKPDDQDQVGCGCAPYDMTWENTVTGDLIDYDPNTLPGTDFLCTGPDYITDDGTNLKFMLQPEMTCRMFCDNYHIVTMTCVNGLWTGEPELGAWCYAEPVLADDMGEGTRAPTTTTPAAPPTQ